MSNKKPVAKKSLAQDRTIDMFSGKTREEANSEEVFTGDAPAEQSTASPEIEHNVDRYREQAFKCQEWSSKLFGDARCDETGSFRLSSGSGWLYLERLGKAKDGKAYSYAGVMFKETELLTLAEVFVAAAREYKKNAK